MSVVALLTDFGTKDSFVGAMKGQLLKAAPNVSLVDITHEVPPHDIRFAAFQLRSTYRDFPEGTLFLAAVDPGMKGEQRTLYAEASGQKFIGSDNGILSWVFDESKPSRVIEISPDAARKKAVSATFPGRDVYAPLAGRILRGEDPLSFGKAVSSWTNIPFPKVEKTGSLWKGEVLCNDAFGNVITNFPSKDVQVFADAAKMWIEFGPPKSAAGHPPVTIRGLSKSYNDVDPGKLLAIAGSAGFIEISVRDGSAAEKTKLKPGDRISIQFRT